MSIDQARSAGSPKTSVLQDSRSIKGKAGDAGDTPEGGFSSLLTAISPSVELPAGEAGVFTRPLANDKDLKEDVSLLLPAPAISLVDLSSSMNIRVDGESRVSGGLSALKAAAAGLGKLSESFELQAVKSTNAVVGEALVSPTVGISVQAEGLQGLDPRVQNLLHGRLSMDSNVGDSVVNAQLTQPDRTLADASLSQIEVGASLDPRAQKLLQARRVLGEDLKADVTKVRLESLAVRAASDLDLSAKDAIQAKLSVTGDFAARLLEPLERPRGKSFGSAGPSAAEGGWTPYAHHIRPVGDMPSNPNPVVTVQAQAQVADKVSYWLTQGIQNAELTLDGFGSEPVEVSILLKGGEAHVGFRSDLPEVRQMLEGAVSQLKDALGREGVLLSGVTVGGSGADGSGRQQEQRQGFNANRGGGTAQVASEPRILRAPMSVGRSLDIFV